MDLLSRIKELCEEKDVSIARLEQETGLANGSIRKWSNSIPSGDRLAKVADYFNVTTDYLLGRTDNISAPEPDSEVEEILEVLHKRPEMKTLFSISKKATKDDIEKTLKIIEALKDE